MGLPCAMIGGTQPFELCYEHAAYIVSACRLKETSMRGILGLVVTVVVVVLVLRFMGVL